MKKPIDPRKSGLKEPQPFISETLTIELNTNSLYEIMEIWEEAQREILQAGKQITSGPDIEAKYYNVNKITYVVSYINSSYAQEQEVYTRVMSAYLKQCEEFENRKQRLVKKEKEDLVDQISRLEKRLANLYAVRDNKPLPFDNKP